MSHEATDTEQTVQHTDDQQNTGTDKRGSACDAIRGPTGSATWGLGTRTSSGPEATRR